MDSLRADKRIFDSEIALSPAIEQAALPCYNRGMTNPNEVLDPKHPQYEFAKSLNKQLIDAAYKLHELGVTEQIIVEQVQRALHV